MNKNKLLIMLVMITVGIAGCDLTPVANNQSIETTSQKTESKRMDAEVIIDEATSFLTLSDEEKKAEYEKLDLIEMDTQNTLDYKKFTQLVEVNDAETYQQLFEESQSKAIVVYLGFDECPYCKAFVPKMNHLAKEVGVTVNYYNTMRRNKDSNFDDVIAFYSVETVPHAFIVHKGKIVDVINHMSTMESIEKFMEKVAELNK